MTWKIALVTGVATFTALASAQDILPDRPRIGVRASVGTWNRTMVGLGADVTWKIPFTPIPTLRLDGEVWGNPSDFGKGKRGNAISLLGVKNLPLLYMGAGPTYWFTSDHGDHDNGLGAKLLVGANIPGSNSYLEGSVILGSRPAAFFVSYGIRF